MDWSALAVSVPGAAATGVIGLEAMFEVESMLEEQSGEAGMNLAESWVRVES